MKLFSPHPWSGHAISAAVALLVLQIPVSRHFLTLYVDESVWHLDMVLTFVVIALLLAYRYGFRGGILSSVLATLIAAIAEWTHFGMSNRSLDVPLTVSVGIATLATGSAASVAVGLLAHVLQAHRKWLESLFASASDGVIVVATDRRILAMNPAAERMSGWAASDLGSPGGCATLFRCGGDSHRCPADKATCPISISGKPLAGLETEIYHRRGALVPVSIGSSPVELPIIAWRRSLSSAVVVTIRDIATARKLQAEMESLAKICTDISSLPHVDQILQEITSRARSILGADLVVLAMTAGQPSHLTIRHVSGSGADRAIGLEFAADDGILGRAYRLGAPIVIRHPADDPGYAPDRDSLAKTTGLLCQVAVPLGGAGEAPGVIGVGWYQSRVILPNNVTVLRQLANLAGVALENSDLLGQIQRRRQEAEALCRMGLEISSLSDFDRKLELVMAETRSLVAADVTALWVMDDGKGSWTHVSAAAPEEARAWLSRSGLGLVTEAVQAGQVLKVEHLTAHIGLTAPEGDHSASDQFRAGVALPLRVRGRPIGALFAGYRTRSTVGPDAVLMLSGLSNQLSVAMENAGLYRRVQELAVMEERNRLSREIHDGLAQTLAMLNLRAEALKKSLGRLGRVPARGGGRPSQDPAELALEVEELQAIVDMAYGEVRHSIWNLRRPEQSDQDLPGLLLGFAAQFRRYTGISIAVESDSSAHLHLPLPIELHVIRIVQESLNNVRKHSGVKTAILSVRTEAEMLVLEIRDHGRGFDSELVRCSDRGTYGLASMSERAKAIGADLSVESRPGAGTTVRLCVALDRLTV